MNITQEQQEVNDQTKSGLQLVFREVAVDFVDFLITKKGLPLKNYKGDKTRVRDLFNEFVLTQKKKK